MSTKEISKTSMALKGIQRVKIDPQPPFFIQNIPQCKESHHPSTLKVSNSKNKVTGRLSFKTIWEKTPAYLNPICGGCSHGDRSFMETVANVLTSLPFVYLGFKAPRRDLNTKLYANSLIGVGVVSSLYHSSRGRLRKYLRWADYTMIATASVCLSRAIRNNNSRALTAASVLCMPISPLMVSAVHTGLMELSVAQRARNNPELRTIHNVHMASALLGGALFIGDDYYPETPYVHAGWHLAAAGPVGTCNQLLE